MNIKIVNYKVIIWLWFLYLIVGMATIVTTRHFQPVTNVLGYVVALVVFADILIEGYEFRS